MCNEYIVCSLLSMRVAVFTCRVRFSIVAHMFNALYKPIYTITNIKITRWLTLFFSTDVTLLLFAAVHEPWLSICF